MTGDTLEGHNIGLNIKNSSASSSAIGGLVGKHESILLMGTSSSSVISSKNSSGGLVGEAKYLVTRAFSGTVSATSTAKGVSADKDVGGLVGTNSSTLTGYSLGWVVVHSAYSNNTVGAVVGVDPATPNGYYNSIYNGNTTNRVGNSNSVTRTSNTTGKAIAGVSAATTSNMSGAYSGIHPVNLAADVGKWVFVADKWSKLVLPTSVTDMLDLEMTDVNQPKHISISRSVGLIANLN